MIVDRVMPQIEKAIEGEVDEIIKCELKNLFLKLQIKKSNEKRPRPPRPPKPPKPPKIPGAK